MDIEQSNFTRTDHDRYGGADRTDFATTGSKEQLDIKDEDAMDIDQKASNLPDDGAYSLESLQKDMGSAFHLCKTCKVSLRRDPVVF